MSATTPTSFTSNDKYPPQDQFSRFLQATGLSNKRSTPFSFMSNDKAPPPDQVVGLSVTGADGFGADGGVEVGVGDDQITLGGTIVAVVFGVLTVIAFILLIVSAVKIDRAAASSITASPALYTALSVTFAALFLLPMPLVNLALAIASIVLVKRLGM